MCDAGLGASLGHYLSEGWVPISTASRFLISHEEKYHFIKLLGQSLLLGVIVSVKHFTSYTYGKSFTVVRDHQLLLIALNVSEKSKTGIFRLIRWIDKLLSFILDIKHLAASKLGLTDYLSRNPASSAVSAPTIWWGNRGGQNCIVIFKKSWKGWTT